VAAAWLNSHRRNGRKLSWDGKYPGESYGWLGALAAYLAAPVENVANVA